MHRNGVYFFFSGMDVDGNVFILTVFHAAADFNFRRSLLLLPLISGTIALFANESTSLVAFPAKQLGYVHVVDITNPTPNETISVLFPAHKHDVSSITFSSTGQYIATASTQGTLIRVFSTRKGKQLIEFRRSRVPATICAVSFNARDTRLAVISSTGTLHVFSLAPASTPAPTSAASTFSQFLAFD